jgi:hypothetical protein
MAEQERPLPEIEDVNLEEFLTDIDTDQAAEELKPKPGVIEIPERKEQDTPIMDVLFGPKGVELAGDSFLTTGKAARRIAERVAGVKEEDLTPLGDVDPFTGFVGGVVNGTILIPYSFVNIAAEITDALNKDGIPVDQGKVAQLEKYFSNTVLGKIQQGSEDIVKESAVGKLTSALVELYGLGRMGAAGAVKVGDKALEIYNKFSKAAKANKVATGGSRAAQAGKKAEQLNKLAGKKKFAAVTIGGAAGASLVADIEDIGTWGDWLGGPTELDRETRETADDDALRKLYNRFRFGAEGAAVSVPIAYGTNLIAKRIAEAGRKLKYSDDLTDQWIAKWIQEPFLPEGRKDRFLFESMKRVEGEMAGGQVVARDLIIDIDQTLAKIAKESGLRTGNPAWKRLVGRLDELLTSTDDVIQGGKISFKGFDQKKLNQFREFVKEIGLNKNNADDLINEMFKVRNQFNVFKNTFLKESKGNLNVANKEFMNIMKDRMNTIFTSEYKIFTDKSIVPWFNYKPTEDAIRQVKEVLGRYAKQNGTKLSDESLNAIIKDIQKNVTLNPITKTPEFPLSSMSVLDDKASQLINIADNIKGNKFKPTNLIQSEADLRGFQRFFGLKRDLRNTIINTMSDLSGLVAKNRFYNSILEKSKELTKNGQRAIVYPNRLEAVNNLTNQKIIAGNGLKLKSPLNQEAYTNPLDGYFTSEGFAEALNFSEKLMTDGFAKNVIYQHLFLIPKGLTQISKTILGPFTHARNFITSAQFSLGTGNLFKNPVEMVRNFKQSFNTIQPQLLYRNTPKDQALYRFLLEEQVVSSSATARDIQGVLDDIGKGGDVYMRFFGKFGKGIKKLYEKAGDLYVAEDDFFKVYNFLAEFDTYKKSYSNALKKGVIKAMPDDLTIMKEAANIVKNTVPNYNYVGPFGQNIRRAPIGNFVSFPIEVTRTANGILQQAISEINNPIFRDIGYKRLLGFGTAVATAPAMIVGMLKGMYGITDSIISSVRELAVPSYAEDSTIGVITDKDGNYKYIDISSFLVYDTVQNPIVSIIAGIEREKEFAPDKPLTVGLGKGLESAVARFLRPFVEESIYFNAFNNIIMRNGITNDGKKLWNPDAPKTEKFEKALQYALLEVAPLSAKQFERLYYAATNQPNKRGEKFEVSDELAGFYGLRSVKVDPIKSLNYKINDFKNGLRNTRSLFTSDVLTGGPVDQNKILERFYIANQQRFEQFKNLKRKIQAAETLNATNRDLSVLFDKRQENNNYAALKSNRFIPFEVTETTIDEFRRQEKELREKFDDLGIPAGLSRDTLRKIYKMTNQMYRLRLDDNFNKSILLEDYLSSLPGASGERQVTQVPPLPVQPMPNQQVISPPMPQMSQLNQGLTPTESALLSQEEQQIRLRQRGLA